MACSGEARLLVHRVELCAERDVVQELCVCLRQEEGLCRRQGSVA
jgi:hypothetical protein